MTADADTADDRVVGRHERAVVGGVLALALALRVAAAKLLSSPVDESASVLAVQVTADTGAPILPSGVPYLQGALLSYLLAPLDRIGLGGIDHLFLLRQVSVISGVAAVALTYLVARRLTRRWWFAALTALLLAVDPRSVAWGSAVRMYAVLQMLTVGLVWALVRWADEPSTRRAALVVVLGWLAVYSTLLGALVFPGLVAAAWLRPHRSAAGRRQLLGLTVGLAAAPLSLVALNRVLARTGSAVSSDGRAATSVGFVGDHLLSSTPNWRPPLEVWLQLWYGSWRGLAALLVVLASVVVLVGWRRSEPGRGAGRAALVGCYWVQVVVLLVLGRGLEPRYFVNVQPLGLLVLGVALADVVAAVVAVPPRTTTGTSTILAARLAAGALALTVLATSVVTAANGLSSLDSNRVRGSDLLNAARYVAARHRKGDTVLVSLPPPMYLALGSADDIVFVSGRTRSSRTRLYTRRTGQRLEDFWVGSRVATSGRQVCGLLTGDPNAWLVVDDYQLTNPSGYKGPLATSMLALTIEIASAPGGVTIRRVRPDAARLAASLPACHQS